MGWLGDILVDILIAFTAGGTVAAAAARNRAASDDFVSAAREARDDPASILNSIGAGAEDGEQ